jgi:hypothetical protein
MGLSLLILNIPDDLVIDFVLATLIVAPAFQILF